MSLWKSAPLEINGWRIFIHPLFLGQVEALIQHVEAHRKVNPGHFIQQESSQRLCVLSQMAFTTIPQNPALPEYKGSSPADKQDRHWCYARLMDRYRLFFRYHPTSRIILYAWISDEQSQENYAEGESAYRIFRKMLGV